MIGSYLIDKITLRESNGTDTHQEPLTPTDVPLRAFIEYKERRIEDRTGQIIVSKAKVMIRPRTTIETGLNTRGTKKIAYEDEIIFPDGTVHAIKHIGQSRDFSIRSTDVYVA